MALTLSDNSVSALAKLLFSVPEYQERIGVRELWHTMSGFFDKTEDYFEHGREVPTVLLVPGIACRAAVMKVLGEPLKEEFNVAYAPDFDCLGFADVYESAMLLRQKIDQVLAEHSDDVYLLGHSLGSLIGLEALRVRNGVSKIVMLSPPFKGSPHASLAKGLSPACRQLSPDSDYLKSLEEINLGDTEVYSYISADDVVVPVGSQVPHEGISNNLQVFMRPYLHHDFIIGQKARDFAERLKGVFGE